MSRTAPSRRLNQGAIMRGLVVGVPWSTQAGEPPRQIDAGLARPSPQATGTAPETADHDLDVRALLARGDRRGAIGALMDAHGERVFGFCVRILRSRTLAEDVLQRVFLDAYRDVDRCHGRSTLFAWLMGIASHRCQDALRSRRRHLQRVESNDQAIVRLADPGTPQSEHLDRARILAALDECLRGLSDEVRTAVLLRFQHGKSYDEMSRLLRVKPNTLHVRVARALPVLKHCLEGKGWIDE
jgi:RNA polymerase sigma-70 factor (ECF subfamily)